MNPIYRCLLTSLFCHAALAGGSDSSAFRRILRIQDTRDARALLPLVTGVDPAIRRQALFAVGSVQDTFLLPSVAGRLTDSMAEIRGMAAFALGQMNPFLTQFHRRKVSASLTAALNAETEAEVQDFIIEAMGKAGDSLSLAALVSSGADFARPAAAVLSVGRYAYRGITSADATRRVVQHLSTLPAPETWKAAYALMRIADPELLLPYVHEIVGGLRSEEPDTRMHLLTALGKTREGGAAFPAIMNSLRRDPDWRVRVNAARAAGQYDAGTVGLTTALLRAADDSNEHVSLAALTALGEIKGESFDPGAVQGGLEAILLDRADRYSMREKGVTAVSLAAQATDGAYEVLSAAYREGLLDREAYLSALGLLKDDNGWEELLKIGQSTDARSQRIALEGLIRRIEGNAVGALKIRETRDVFLSALQSTDMAVITTAATALGDSTLANSASVPGLLAALRRLKSPHDVEPMIAVIQALGALRDHRAIPDLETALRDSDGAVAEAAASALTRLTGRSYGETHQLPRGATYRDYDWNYLIHVIENPVVILKTSRGEVRLRLLPDQAPFTCMSFVRLAVSGFYNGLTFHRVVPNFVVQGGDPRGDGWGGPGYSIRSEFGTARYERGTVGMASSGKDTEGCQFFITHSAQPHLDGRYTIFAVVERGMDVVDALQIGDRILSVIVQDGSKE